MALVFTFCLGNFILLSTLHFQSHFSTYFFCKRGEGFYAWLL